MRTARITVALTLAVAACSAEHERPPPAQDCDAATCIHVARDAGADAADASLDADADASGDASVDAPEDR